MKPNQKMHFTKSLLSALLLFLTLFPISLLHVFFHELGHAFTALAYGESGIQLFIHPFAFSAYARPFLSLDTTIFHLAGPMAGVIIPFLIYLFTRKQKSMVTLFHRLLFPWSLFAEGLNTLSVTTGTGDFYNIVRLTGIPTLGFAILGIVMVLIGIVLFASYLPQLGIPEGSIQSLWVVPMGMIFWALVSYFVGIFLVPSSDFVIQWQLQEEIQLVSVMWIFIILLIGVMIGLVNLFVVRYVYKAIHREEQRLIYDVQWKDLRWPTIWFAFSFLIGIIWILV